jgi:hypothetical protein
MDLTPFIDITKSEILNAKGGLDDVFLRNPDDKASAAPTGITSDCDPQLLIILVFKEPIKLASLKFICPKSGTRPIIAQLGVRAFETDLVPSSQLTRSR